MFYNNNILVSTYITNEKGYCFNKYAKTIQ